MGQSPLLSITMSAVAHAATDENGPLDEGRRTVDGT
jgi:hypothetical protein